MTARTIAAVDTAMGQEDTAPLEAAFAAEDDELPTPTVMPHEAGFRTFMTHYQRRVRNLLRHYLRRPQDVDEAMQDVFMKMWVCWDDEQTPEHRHSLVFRVARNTACDRLKSRAFREYERTMFAEDVDAPVVAVADAAPDLLLLRAERVAAVRAALADLPPEQRELLVARWYEDTSFAHLAANLGTTPRALITQQTRIFKKLKPRLAQATVLPLAGPGLLQRLRALMSLMPEVTHTAMIGVLVTSVAAPRPAAIALDRDRVVGSTFAALDWQRPAPMLTRFVGQVAAASGGDLTTRVRAAGPGRSTALEPRHSDRTQRRYVPTLPLPTHDVEVGRCDEGAAGDQIDVEVRQSDIGKCRNQNVVEVCPVVPSGLPGVNCHTQGQPSYLVPLPAPGTGTTRSGGHS